MNGNPKSVEINRSELMRRLDAKRIVHGGGLIVCFLMIFGPALPSLYRDWLAFDTFSHGLLVPFIAAYMAWQKRAQLAAVQTAPSLAAVALLLPAVALGLLGRAIGDAFAERVALVLCFAGAVWSFFGWPLFKRLNFPLGYLLLMIPLPYVIVKEVAYHLRILNAALAAPALRTLGVPVYRDSYYLHLPDITLEVADLCSGISSVFALLALGAAYVYFSPLRPRWKIVAVFSTFPFAAFINLIRIVLTAALAYHVSPAVLGVLIHELTGTITFFIALCLFIALSEFLLRRFNGPRTAGSGNPVVAGDGSGELGRSQYGAGSWRPTVGALAVFIPAVLLSFNLGAQGTMSLARDLGNLPRTLAGYDAMEQKNPDAYRDPDAEKELSRRYVNSHGEAVDVYIGFRGTQIGAKRLRSPKLQFPYGWNFVWTEPARMNSASGAAINGHWMLTQNNQIQILVLYWYQSKAETFAGEVQNRLRQLRGAIVEQRTDGAVVRLGMATNAERIDHTKARLTAFARELYPELLGVLPQ